TPPECRRSTSCSGSSRTGQGFTVLKRLGISLDALSSEVAAGQPADERTTDAHPELDRRTDAGAAAGARPGASVCRYGASAAESDQRRSGRSVECADAPGRYVFRFTRADRPRLERTPPPGWTRP